MVSETVSTLRTEAFVKLSALRDIKKGQLQDYFEEKIVGAETLSHGADLQHLYAKLVEYHQATEVQADGNYDVMTAEYKQIWDAYGPAVMEYQKDSGVYDVFLICAKHGHVMYTCAKESDLGENLGHGKLKDSGLAKVWRDVKDNDKVSMADFEPYAPSNGEPCSFIGLPLHDSNHAVVGVMAIQVPLDQINSIMTDRSGLGQTGETYLVGQDQLMRSDSFLDPENHAVKASFANPEKGKVDTEASREAIDGNTDTKVVLDYNGNPVLSAYCPVDVYGVKWGLMAEIDVAEAYCPKNVDGDDYYKEFVDVYGYRDLFLINPDGYCFYTVGKEADYQTNLVSGKYSSSNLGGLVRSVLGSRQMGVADYASYAPSNGDMSSFMATPIMIDGKVEMVVAVAIVAGPSERGGEQSCRHGRDRMCVYCRARLG